MGKAKTKGKQRLDKYYHLAKELGYRSRAAFKLTQLDEKFRFLPSSRSVLDLCAAPGGWLQVAVRNAPAGAFVLGVDLFPIRPIRGAHSVVEDITTSRCRAAVRRLMDSNGCPAFDCVLHDGSPNVGGAWAQEATSQSSLVIDALKLATEFLAPKGTFVTKVFRSQDYSAILFCLKQLFDKVEVTKPAASRSTSAEIYVVGLRYKAPAKIDPRLLDVKHLFQGDITQSKVVDVLRGSKQKRNREGYEDGNTTLRKVGLASDFVWSETPLEYLGSVNLISFDDPACLAIKEHELTTDEVKALCEDLRILDKNSFKHLLRWRMRIRQALSPTQKKTEPTVKDKKDETEGNDDDRMLNEMEELTNVLERKKRKEKKQAAKRRVKDKARKATGMQVDATEDSYHDLDLFSLASIKGRKDLVTLDSADLYDGDEMKDSDDDDFSTNFKDENSDVDSDDQQQRYDDELDDFYEQAYERFMEKRGSKTMQKKRAKRKLSDGDAQILEEDGDQYEMDEDVSDDDKNENEENPLMIHFQAEPPTQDELTEKWFTQDVFAGALEDGMLAESDSEDDIVAKKQEKKVDMDVAPSRSDREDGLAAKKQMKKLETSNISRENVERPIDSNNKKKSQEDDFEIVPAEPMHSSDDSSSDESEEEDDYSKAEILAYAKKMLRKKQRELMLDDAYNKYTFDDEGLPKWFADDEKRHRQPMKPITKEEVAAMKAQFKEIDARPAKKVAQAKARKKRIAMKSLEKARKKAASISDQTDLPDRSKVKMIDKLYKKAVPKRPKKEFVVAKKGVQVKGGKGKVVVDRRMKKDARSRGSGKPGKGGGKKVKGVKGKGKGQGGKRATGMKGKNKRN